MRLNNNEEMSRRVAHEWMVCEENKKMRAALEAIALKYNPDKCVWGNCSCSGCIAGRALDYKEMFDD